MTRMSVLFMAALGLVSGDRPMFCDPVCTTGVHGSCDCDLTLHDRFEQRMYVPVGAGQTVRLTVRNSLLNDLRVEIATPIPYEHRRVNISGMQLRTSGNTYDTVRKVYYPHFQTVEHYLALDSIHGGNFVSNGNTRFFLTNDYTSGHVNFLFKVGNEYRVDVMEILTMPMSMFQTHGYYWTQHGYFWIFTIVGAASATVYVLFGRFRLWQVVAIYAASAFSIVFFEKLYHAILAAHHAGTVEDVTFAVACNALLAEGIPFLFAILFIRQAVCRPLVWSIVAIALGAGFIFVAGAGWYVGTGLLISAALTRLTQRIVSCAI